MSRDVKQVESDKAFARAQGGSTLSTQGAKRHIEEASE